MPKKVPLKCEFGVRFVVMAKETCINLQVRKMRRQDGCYYALHAFVIGLNLKELIVQDMMGLLMAYYVVHQEKINLDDIKIPVEETREENGEEGSFSDIPYTILGLHHLEQKLNR